MQGALAGGLRAAPPAPGSRAGGGRERWGGDAGARGRSHANAARTIRPGASAPPEAEAGTKH